MLLRPTYLAVTNAFAVLRLLTMSDRTNTQPDQAGRHYRQAHLDAPNDDVTVLRFPHPDRSDPPETTSWGVAQRIPARGMKDQVRVSISVSTRTGSTDGPQGEPVGAQVPTSVVDGRSLIRWRT